MNNWIPKKENFRFAVLAVLVSVALYFAGLALVSVETKKVENFYRDSESEFSKEQRVLAIRSMAESNTDAIQTLRGYFIQKGDEVKFIEEIEKVAKNSSTTLEIVSIDPKQSKSELFKEDLNVKLSVEGQWENIMRFINGLERMPFGVLIQTTNIKAKDRGGWFGFIEITVFREK